jgi:hypothetical protein
MNLASIIPASWRNADRLKAKKLAKNYERLFGDEAKLRAYAKDGLAFGPLQPGQQESLMAFDERVFVHEDNQYSSALAAMAKKVPFSVYTLADASNTVHGYISMLFFQQGAFINHEALGARAANGYLPEPRELLNHRDLIRDMSVLQKEPVDCYIDGFAIDLKDRHNERVGRLFGELFHLMRSTFSKVRIANVGTIVVDSEDDGTRGVIRKQAHELYGARWAHRLGLEPSKYGPGHAQKSDLVRIYYGKSYGHARELWELFIVAYFRHKFKAYTLTGIAVKELTTDMSWAQLVDWVTKHL